MRELIPARVRRRLEKTIPCPPALAQSLVLMADHADQFGIAGFQFDCLAPGAIRQLRLPYLGSGVAIFIPDRPLARRLPGQLLV